MPFQQFPKEPYRGATIPARLHQDVEHVAVLVHRAPEILLAAVERDEELVEVPRVALLTAPAPQRPGIVRAERQAPLADGLVADGDPPLSQEILDVAETEAETVIQPHRFSTLLLWTTSQQVLLMPPGEYQVTTRMRPGGEAVVWPNPVRVGEGEAIDVSLRSVIRAEFPEDVEPYRWAVVAAGDDTEVLYAAEGREREILMPPGEYRVTTRLRPGDETVLSPDIVRVTTGQVTVVRPEISAP